MPKSTSLNLDMTNLEDLNQVLYHPPLLTSQKANWSNIFLAHYQHPGSEICEHRMQQLTLEIMDVNSWTHHERRMGKNHFSYRMGGGEITLCPAHTSHWTSWKETISFTILTFKYPFFEKIADEILDSQQIEFEPKWKIFDPLIQNIVNALKADVKAGCPAGKLYGESFGTALAVHLIKNFSVSKSYFPEYSDGLPKYKLKQVIDYIEANLSEDIKLADLANTVGISCYYFCRLFKQSLQMTPHQYVIYRRIELAKQLLQQSDFSIADVALLCGFAHQSHLSRHFQRLVGMSPKKFRNY
ncbi:MAG: AraC family transcriptional regulator [Hapalosiphonaceae cyanobacterium JJU2]|nr:MAG: AraC family transcriptional regulator [Hapalosiphonaceae cyanobacterium JJU2]